MPDKNTKKYLWDKKLTASFNFEGALEVAAAAAALAEGKESLVADSKGTLPSWYRDPAKCGRDGNAKIIGFYRPKDPPNGSKVRYFLGITENNKSKDGQKIGISLEYPDLFKIARVMEEAALAILGWRKKIEERCYVNGHASPGTSDPHTSDIGAANTQSTAMSNGTVQQKRSVLIRRMNSQ